MRSVEQSPERALALGIEGIARLDVVLRQNELEWRHITDAISVNVVVQSTTGTCLFANRTALEYWGLKLEGVMVANYRAPVHPYDAAQMYARRQEGLTKGIPLRDRVALAATRREYRGSSGATWTAKPGASRAVLRYRRCRRG
jgi:PAS domain-containing protein